MFYWPRRASPDSLREGAIEGRKSEEVRTTRGWPTVSWMTYYFEVHNCAKVTHLILPSCVLSVDLIQFNNSSWLLRPDRGCAPFVSSGVLRMLFIISQAIIPTAELTPRLICLLLWRFLNRQGCVNDTVHYLSVTVLAGSVEA